MSPWHGKDAIFAILGPGVTLLPVLQTGLLGIALVLLAGSLARFRRSMVWTVLDGSSRGQLLGACLLAGIVRVGVIPSLSRHVYDGHEADYFDAWRGLAHSLGQGYRASAWMGWLYQAGGALFQGDGRQGDGQTLILITIGFSLLAVPFMFYLARRLGASPQGSVVACLLFAVDPIHAFWASSAYNIELPFILLLAAWASLELGIQTWKAAPLVASGFLLSAAVAARSESVLLVFVLVWRLLTAGPQARKPHLGLVWMISASPVLLHLASDAQALAGQAPAEYARELALQQWSLWLYLAPWSQVGIRELWLGAWLLAMVRKPWTRSPLVLCLAVVAGTHLATIPFDDYDFRHTLLPRAALMLGMGVCWSALWEGERQVILRRMAPAVVIPLFCLLLWNSHRMGMRYYADWEMFLHDVPEFATAPHLKLEQYRTCVFVAEDTYYSQYARASHFELYTQRDRERLMQRSQGCILFVLDLENYQASSRSIDGRAAKLAHLYTLTLLGKVIDREAEHASLVYRVGPHR